MPNPIETPHPILELDNELTEHWTISSTFQTGVLEQDQVSEIVRRDVATHGEQQVFVLMINYEVGTTMVLTNDSIEGTQEEALRLIARRYTSVLGALATGRTVISSRMNVYGIVDALLEPYDLDPLTDDDEPLSEAEWDLMHSAPDPLTLDVTPHLKRLLKEIAQS